MKNLKGSIIKIQQTTDFLPGSEDNLGRVERKLDNKGKNILFSLRCLHVFVNITHRRCAEIIYLPFTCT